MGIVESTYAELKQQELKNNPYSCLHMADIDINPHQVEAFTFALSSLLRLAWSSSICYAVEKIKYYLLCHQICESNGKLN